MTTAEMVGPYRIAVRTQPAFRFVTLYFGQVFIADTLLSESTGVANYELAKIDARSAARALLTADEFHAAGFCSKDDHCGCISDAADIAELHRPVSSWDSAGFNSAEEERRAMDEVEAYDDDARSAARALLTADEFHAAGFCSVDDHCGCISETPVISDDRKPVYTPCIVCGEQIDALRSHICSGNAESISGDLPAAQSSHVAGFCSKDDHCGCISETPAPADVASPVLCRSCSKPCETVVGRDGECDCLDDLVSQQLAAGRAGAPPQAEKMHAAGASKQRARLAASFLRARSFTAWTELTDDFQSWQIVTNAPDEDVQRALRVSDVVIA